MFDPIVISLDIFRTQEIDSNESQVIPFSLDIELIITFFVLIQGNYTEFNYTSHSIPHGDQVLVDFSIVIDPTLYFINAWSFYDNTISIGYLRESPESKINIEFKLKFWYNSFFDPYIDLTIDYAIHLHLHHTCIV